MSPSRRRAIGAVRGMAVRPVSGALGVTGRRALRGYRGGARRRPQQNSQRVLPPLRSRGARCHYARASSAAYYARALPTRITLRRDGDIAPYRHYTRVVRTHITHRHTHRHYTREIRPWGLPTLPASCPTAIYTRHYTRALPMAARHPDPLPDRSENLAGVRLFAEGNCATMRDSKGWIVPSFCLRIFFLLFFYDFLQRYIFLENSPFFPCSRVVRSPLERC